MGRYKYKIKKIGGISFMTTQTYKKLDLDKIRNKKSTIVSSKEALEKITPIDWSKDVLSGNKKVIISR
jgi:hypothetical protein